jgi:hypothetical protein
MSDRIYPTFDNFPASWSLAWESKELAKFRELHPDYDTSENLQTLNGFCALHCIPATCYNLEIALQDAIADGRVEKSNREELDAAREFLKVCPEYDRNFACRKNSDALIRWLESRALPITTENLFKAFEACVKNRTIRPTKEGQGIINLKQATYIRAGQNIMAEDRKKYADHPYESDVVRKKRDEELRRAAAEDRIARRNARR